MPVVRVVVVECRSESATRTHVRLPLRLYREGPFLLQWGRQKKAVETASNVVQVEETGASLLGRGAVARTMVVQRGRRWDVVMTVAVVVGDGIQVREEGGRRTLAVSMRALSKV
jgi:hypothetical protein